MKKRIVLFLALLAVMPLAAHAQTGCGDSPENPTYLLALLGGASAAATALYRRIFPK